VASQSSVHHAPHPGLSPHSRASGADAKPSGAFALFLDDRPDHAPASPKLPQKNDSVPPSQDQTQAATASASKKDRSAPIDANSSDQPAPKEQKPDGSSADSAGDSQTAPQTPVPVAPVAKAVTDDATTTEATSAETKPEDQKAESSDAATASTTGADTGAAPPVQPAVPVVVASIAVPTGAAAPHAGPTKEDSGADAAPASIQAMAADPAGKTSISLVQTTLPTASKSDKKAQPPGSSSATADTKATQASPAANPDQSAAPSVDDGEDAGKPRTSASPTPENAANSENARVHTAANSDAPKTDTSTNQAAPTHFATDSSADKPSGGLQFVTVQQQSAPSASQATPATPSPANPPVAVPLVGLAVTIATQAQAGHNRFAIRLDPPELGRIDVRLDVDKSGHVTSHLVVDRPDTLDALQRDAGDLQRALQQAGLKTSDNGLQFSLRDQSFAGRNNPFPLPNAARLVVPDPELSPAESISTSYSPALRVVGAIDIRV
jgi:flagellar hook-length control protein FliK